MEIKVTAINTDIDFSGVTQTAEIAIYKQETPFFEIGDLEKLLNERKDKMLVTNNRPLSNPCREIISDPSMTFNGLWFTLEKPKKEATNWEFKSSSNEDIYWNDIKNSLSYKEPLALVTRTYKAVYENRVEKDEKGNEVIVKYVTQEPDEQVVVVDKRLMDKAHLVDEVETMPDIVDTLEPRVFLIGNNFSNWVTWAKYVKNAGYPEPVKSKIKVVLPNI